MTAPRCWRCGGPATGEVPTGPPEHTWRWWCKPCLNAAVLAPWPLPPIDGNET